MQLHQAVVLTTKQISPETLQKVFMVLQGREGGDGDQGWQGTMFLLKDTIDVENMVSQIELESLYGQLA